MTEIYLAENHLLLEAGYGNPEMYSHSAHTVDSFGKPLLVFLFDVTR